MPTYILLLTLTPDGQKAALHDPQYLLRVEDAIRVPGVQPLGLYGVLGEYDFVTIVEATDNERMARFSLELGVMADVHITTLPAVPIARLGADIALESLEAQEGVPEGGATGWPPTEARYRER